jgi:hypothetical protein
MSVATRTRSSLSLKRLSVRVRWFCALLPWIASASMPAALSCFARRLAVLAHGVLHLRDELGGGVAARDLDGHRVLHERARQLADLVGEGGGEQQVLPRLGQQPEDAADVMDEAHVEHAVGLVEDEDLDLAQVDGLLLDVVEQAAGRGDQHVDAAAQRVDLRADADAAEHQRALQRKMLSIGAHILFHLRRELAGRGDDERAHRVARRRMRAGVAFLGQPLQQRQREAGGLAGAGLRGAQQVASRKNDRDGLRLDGGGGGVALARDSAEQLGPQAK